MKPVRIGLLRHGATDWNARKRIQGQTDTELSSRGREQVRSWIGILQTMNWRRILCSDLLRTRQTAKDINKVLNLPLHRDARLREQDWGTWTGACLKDLYRTNREEMNFQENQGWNFRPPGGENRFEVRVRAESAIKACLINHPEEDLLVITHLGVIKTLVYHILNRSFLPSEPTLLDPGGLHVLTWQQETFTIRQLNIRTT